VIHPVQRGEARETESRETESAALAGFDKRLLLLRSVAQAPRRPAFKNASLISVMAVAFMTDMMAGWKIPINLEREMKPQMDADSRR
jgi:hypothetical protein